MRRDERRDEERYRHEKRRRREERRDERRVHFVENVSKPKNPPNEYHIMIQTNLAGRIICSNVQNLTRFFNYLPDSNSNFRPARINSELISVRMVTGKEKKMK